MSRSFRRTGVLCALSVAALLPVAVAQVTTTAVRGIVRDTSDAVVPNVKLTLRDVSTGIEKSAASGPDGAFIFANMPSGTYSLTASLTGFQTATYDRIVVDTGRTTDVPVQLKVGASNETVEVSGTATQLETSSNEVGKTIDNKSIMDVPLPGRETLNFALLIPGVGNTQGSDRYSTFNGLPNASMDITVDGMNNNSQRWKSGGTSFYEFGPSRIDAMEEVTVSTTGLGADAGGQGAMQIRMTTKRGTDTYHFKVLEQLSNEDFNANRYFYTLQGIARPKVRQNNEVGWFSGKLLPFSNYFKNKLFFFAYFEAQPQPGSTTNQTTLLTQAAQQGNFTYLGTDGAQHTVNLLTVAQQAGLPYQIDPTVAGIQAKINASQSHALFYLPVANQPYYTSMVWGFDTFSNAQYPAARIDYQITPKIAWHGSWNLRHSVFGSSGPPYPGSGYDWNNASTVTTYVASSNLDWSVTPHLLNNFTAGMQTSLEAFNPGGSVYQWAPQNNQVINLPMETNYIPGNVPEVRNNPVYDLIDNMTWVKGKHTVTMGGTYRHTPYYDRYLYYSLPPSYNLGILNSDPAYTTIQNALPFINTSNGDNTNALNLYAQLTGRLTSIAGSNAVDEKTHQYIPYAQLMERYDFNTGSLYAQDSFRALSNLTINYGIRLQMDGPISTQNGVVAYSTPSSFYGPSTRNFHPGELNGNLNPAFGPVKNPYNSDLNNFAPNVGFAWNPTGGNGLIGKLLGDRKTVVRGSFAMNYYNEGLNAVTFVFEGNTTGPNGTLTGQTQALTSAPAGTPGFPYNTLLSQGSLPALSALPGSFTFPMPMSLFTFNQGSSLGYVNPNLVSPYVNNWTLAVQRQLPGNTLLEVRYVGNHSVHLWHDQNVEETNIFENGFLTQFQAAQNNLAIANGLTVAQLQAIPSPSLKVRNFQSTGLPGQVATPIFDAAFGANGSNAALPTSSGYGNSGFITNLEQGAAGAMASTLASTSTPTYVCRLVGSNFAPCAAQGFTQATSFPMNFFRANPFVTSMGYQDDNASSNYNALQVQARKSLSHGLLVDLGYTWSKALGNLQNATSTTASYTWYTLRNGRLNYGPLPFDHRQTLTAFWTWDLPIGKGKLLNLNNKIVDHIFGGWVIGGVEKVISGYPSLLTGGRQTFNTNTGSTSTPGIVLGSGMTLAQLRDRLGSAVGSYNPSCVCFKTNVSDIINANGSANTAFYGPNQTAGQFGDILYFYNKTTFELDASLNKDFKITERLAMGINFQLYNMLNHPFLNFGSFSPTSTSFGYITSTVSGNATGSAAGTRTGQLRAYLSW